MPQSTLEAKYFNFIFLWHICLGIHKKPNLQLSSSFRNKCLEIHRNQSIMFWCPLSVALQRKKEKVYNI